MSERRHSASRARSTSASIRACGHRLAIFTPQRAHSSDPSEPRARQSWPRCFCARVYRRRPRKIGMSGRQACVSRNVACCDGDNRANIHLNVNLNCNKCLRAARQTNIFEAPFSRSYCQNDWGAKRHMWAQTSARAKVESKRRLIRAPSAASHQPMPPPPSPKVRRHLPPSTRRQQHASRRASEQASERATRRRPHISSSRIISKYDRTQTAIVEPPPQSLL